MGLRHREDAEIADLENRLIIECPRKGESVDQFERRRGLGDAGDEHHERSTTGPVLTGHSFGELPLSRKTQLGLKDHESENSDENNFTYRALHDFNWTSRPAPSENNKAAAERHARKLFASLTKKKTQEAYTDVIHQYHKLGHIEKIPPAERLPPPQDTTTWPSLSTTRLYPWVAWSDLKNAYLFDRTPKATRRAHGFMIYEMDEDGSATLQHYHFRGLPMGSSSSASALQTTTGILIELANERSANELLNGADTADTPIWKVLVDNVVNEEELQGLPVEKLYGPSPTAKALAEVLKRLDERARTTTTPEDDECQVKEAYSAVNMRWDTLWKSGCNRVKFVDDVTTGAQSKAILSSLREDEKTCAARIGHTFNEVKEKRSDDDTSAEGFGLIWTSALDGDQLKPKKVNVPVLSEEATDPIRLTVRNVLSLLHQAYDVIGILTWCLLPIKLILRECYTKRLQYDDPVTAQQSKETIKAIQQFNR
ncbi:hypothetical protein Pmar_PMAR027384 [Perkinsus marinus ATCC 50983]|uniref:Uncharacterized protein n=2 Tax=Perkinsus marinus (strain ATCC 50983 / TXsc) TaxID=423536 RepID=C5KSF2_PERM5|nr:hypothetical protein Pmar_PMAR027384 [Perkinsus marinus ATCC 50983]EER12566.1 hypothetical protein Pmar_PMAR027384 [Perkinsus marinus ATCC 50983]|eukprot:XP_002780771.1 hypothetical protein Pmar_PMAR027384 [Perkinsus marinus ATCC 50983]